MDNAYVTLTELAAILHMHRTHVKRFAEKHGFQLKRVRTHSSGNQETFAMSATDAEALREVRERWTNGSPMTEVNGKGWFYMVQLLPEIEPQRIKLGFASDTTQRLNSYRTVCPTATILKSWPCRLTWEACAIASVTRIESQQIGQELFLSEDISRLIERCNEFFALLPNPHTH